VLFREPSGEGPRSGLGTALLFSCALCRRGPRLTAWRNIMSKVTSTQIGAIGENLIAANLIIASKGRFSPFAPVADDTGIDMLVYDKNTGSVHPLQIKCRTKTLNRNPKTVHFEVRWATFKGKRGGYLLAALLDDAALEIRWMWLIPMDELTKVARRGSSKLVIRPSIDLKSKDRYKPYRCAGMREVVKRLIAAQ